MERIEIGNHSIGEEGPCFIIAEGGLNHNGDPEIAKRLIGQAAKCGANAIKFQTYTPEELFPPGHPDYERFQQITFDRDVYLDLKAEAIKYDIVLLSTPFDEASADLLESIDIPAYKIGSGELTHLAFLKYLAGKQKPLLLSTGMSTFDEIDAALEAIRSVGDCPVALLHCVSVYPCPLEDANVRGMMALKDRYTLPTGFSDHTTSDYAALSAVALGACIVEKHFTLSHHLPGWDHFFSYEPEQFKRLVESIRSVESALGTREKTISEPERAIHEIARRAVYARTDIKTGDLLDRENTIVRRPVGPIPAERLEHILGKTIIRDVSSGFPLRPEDFE